MTPDDEEETLRIALSDIDRGPLQRLTPCWYRYPTELWGESANAARVLDYACWKIQACDGEAILRPAEAYVFAGALDDPYRRALRRLEHHARVGDWPALERATIGAEDVWRLPWLRALPSLPEYAKPAGLVLHRWLAVLPESRVTTRLLNYLLRMPTHRAFLQDLPRAVRKKLNDGTRARHGVDRDIVKGAIDFLVDIGLAHCGGIGSGRPRVELTVEPLHRAMPDAVRERARAEPFSDAKARSGRFDRDPARDALDRGNPLARGVLKCTGDRPNLP